MGNGLMALGCLLFLLPVVFLLLIVAYALHPVFGVGLGVFMLLGIIAAIGAATAG